MKYFTEDELITESRTNLQIIENGLLKKNIPLRKFQTFFRE